MCRVLYNRTLLMFFSHSLPKATSAADGDAEKAAPLVPNSVLSLGAFDENTLRERADSLLRSEARYAHMDHLHAVSAFQTETRKLEKNFVVSRVPLPALRIPLHILTITHRSTRGDGFH